MAGAAYDGTTMSYFSAAARDALAASPIEHLDETREVGDGVVVERRSVLWLSAAAVGLLAGGPRAQRQDPAPTPQAGEGIDFAQFLEQMYPVAKRMVASGGRDEEAYLLSIAAALSRLRDPSAPLRQTMQAFRKQHAESGKRFPLMAVSMQLKPGRGFSHHDHYQYDGVIFGVEGEVRIRNYDFVGEVPAIDSDQTFRIRETRDDLILPGRISTLGRTRENVHDLVAGKQGARVLDVFTFFAKDATSRYLDVEDKPVDAELRLYEAAWRKRRRRR